MDFLIIKLINNSISFRRVVSHIYLQYLLILCYNIQVIENLQLQSKLRILLSHPHHQCLHGDHRTPVSPAFVEHLYTESKIDYVWMGPYSPDLIACQSHKPVWTSRPSLSWWPCTCPASCWRPPCWWSAAGTSGSWPGSGSAGDTTAAMKPQ